MNELFLKNTQALFEKDQPLALKLREFKECEQFELFQGSNDNLDINILDKKRKEFIYKNPLKELDESLKLFNGEYLRYPVLFFYGLGNGILYKALLSNPIRNHLIIFEEELEIIYLVFHYLDLSEEIRNEKVVLFYTPNTSFVQIDTLMAYQSIKNYYKTYNLFTHSNFYTNYKNIHHINSLILRSIQANYLKAGNSPADSLQGITQLLHNLPYQLANPSLKDLLKQRKDKIENAIIVSTGPSLMKQLPLLKEYANKASIFCADSAYPILAKHNIKPDYVLSLERIEKTSEFFNNDFKEFDKDILFILTSVIHPNTIKYLKNNDRKFMLVHRSLAFAKKIQIDKYGYIEYALSVANMAYDLAIKLGHKNIILIGQDLAYDENGKSHPKEYHYFKEDFEGNRKQGLFITAYGGNAKVETNQFWILFKESFEQAIATNSSINTYNATEGGARIEGSIEKPFKEVCEELLINDIKKPLKKIYAKNNNIGKDLKKAARKIQSILYKDQQNLKTLRKNLEKIEKLQKKPMQKSIYQFIDKFSLLENKLKSNGSYELFHHLLYHHNLKKNEIFVKNPTNQEEINQQNIELLAHYKETINMLIHILEVFEFNVKNSSCELFQLAKD
ncbi:motility associated factor glycosyltransferase family protein [Campylobacter lari]|uniref:Motility accessory factor n=1 Tax=Campylobacter lari NCTC 11845 TaxID=1388749 RepID=A0A0A8HT14_CAMLA|nr:motility accessory factor [Campylobacter lari]AJD01069.1 motility accessory factor [Campylobacter lari NCTC 11845]EAK9955156.1 motility accessory factor [Campylobacter lari]